MQPALIWLWFVGEDFHCLAIVDLIISWLQTRWHWESLSPSPSLSAYLLLDISSHYSWGCSYCLSLSQAELQLISFLQTIAGRHWTPWGKCNFLVVKIDQAGRLELELELELSQLYDDSWNYSNDKVDISQSECGRRWTYDLMQVLISINTGILTCQDIDEKQKSIAMLSGFNALVWIRTCWYWKQPTGEDYISSGSECTSQHLQSFPSFKLRRKVFSHSVGANYAVKPHQQSFLPATNINAGRLVHMPCLPNRALVLLLLYSTICIQHPFFIVVCCLGVACKHGLILSVHLPIFFLWKVAQFAYFSML